MVFKLTFEELKFNTNPVAWMTEEQWNNHVKWLNERLKESIYNSLKLDVELTDKVLDKNGITITADFLDGKIWACRCGELISNNLPLYPEVKKFTMSEKDIREIALVSMAITTDIRDTIKRSEFSVDYSDNMSTYYLRADDAISSVLFMLEITDDNNYVRMHSDFDYFNQIQAFMTLYDKLQKSPDMNPYKELLGSIQKEIQEVLD